MALRRSELAGLALGDVEPVPGRGLRVLVRRSNINRRGAGQEVAVWANPKEAGFCPITTLEAWLVFRHKGPDITGGVSDAALPHFVGLSKARRLRIKRGADRQHGGARRTASPARSALRPVTQPPNLWIKATLTSELSTSVVMVVRIQCGIERQCTSNPEDAAAGMA